MPLPPRTAAVSASDGVVTVQRSRDRWRAEVLVRVGGLDAALDTLLFNLSRAIIGDEGTVWGVVLHGPSGSGKSLLTKTLAEVVGPDGVASHVVDVGALLSSKSAAATLHATLTSAGTEARAIRAKKECAALVVVVEHAEALARSDEEEDEASTLNMRACIMDILAASLRDWRRDSLPINMWVTWGASETPVPTELCGSGALEGHVVLPTPLGRAQRQSVLAVCSRGWLWDGDGKLLLERASDITAGFLPSDLAAFCRASALSAIRRSSARGEPDASGVRRVHVSWEDLAAARLKVEPAPLRVGSLGHAASPSTLDLTKPVSEASGLNWVIGQASAVATLRARVVGPFAQCAEEVCTPDAQQLPLGVLLSGAPGCGKTFVASQLAKELRARAFSATPADLLASRVGEAEKRLAGLFKCARQCAPSVVILEDIDAVIPAEGGDTGEGSETRVAHVLRTEMDLLRCRRAELAFPPAQRSPLASEALVLVIATMSEKAKLPPWLVSPHRLSLSVHLESKLSVEETTELLRRYLPDCDMSDLAVREVVSALRDDEGGASTVASLCRAAGIQGVRRVVAEGQSDCVRVQAEDLALARASTRAVPGPIDMELLPLLPVPNDRSRGLGT